MYSICSVALRFHWIQNDYKVRTHIVNYTNQESHIKRLIMHLVSNTVKFGNGIRFREHLKFAFENQMQTWIWKSTPGFSNCAKGLCNRTNRVWIGHHRTPLITHFVLIWQGFDSSTISWFDRIIHNLLNQLIWIWESKNGDTIKSIKLIECKPLYVPQYLVHK